MLLRWLKFNFVGGLGIGVQLGMLWLFVSVMHFNYRIATACAVEIAVLHNFFWHEHFTWKDRGGGPVRGMLSRMLRFHIGNGLISIAGNLLLMMLLVGKLGWNYLLANIVAIGICSIANFVAAEWFVFRRDSPRAE